MAHAGGRPLKVDWREDADTLRQADRQEEVAEGRTRLHAPAVRSGWCVADSGCVRRPGW